jgi:hypothetical protein
MKLLSSKKELQDKLFEIIEKSQEKLIIISPFIEEFDYQNNIKWDDMINTLKSKNDILEFYTNPKNITGKEKIVETVNENIIPVDNLHAKIYINDDTVLLSSMNLTHSSYNKSIEFGIITKNPEERKAVLEYCKKYIFISNRNSIFDCFEEKNIKFIKIDFLNLKGTIAKSIEPVKFLKLFKSENTYIECSVGQNKEGFPDIIFFNIKIFKNNKQLINNIGINITDIGIEWSSYFKRKNHYIPLSINNENKEAYDGEWVIPTINVFSEEILGKLMKIYNSI